MPLMKNLSRIEKTLGSVVTFLFQEVIVSTPDVVSPLVLESR